MAHRNFARGSAPPAHSYEWAGVEKPPGTMAGEKLASPPPQRAAVMISETVMVVEKKRWPWVLLAGGVGYIFGRSRK